MVIFGTMSFLSKLTESKCIYMDGTLKYYPKMFMQLYTIHCFIFDEMFPAVFALLPDKKQATY